MKRLLVVAALAVGLAMPAWGQDYDAGFDAFERGDFATALREWRPLAEQGYLAAQVNLGILYYEGEGVPQDYVQSHKWLNIATSRGDDIARKNRDIVAKRMTREQIAEAQRLAREWRPKAE